MSATRPRCPRCDARMAPEQDWCLECGAAATTRIVAPPDWRLAVAIVVAVVAAAAVAVAIVVSSLSGDANDAVAGAPTVTHATAKKRPARRHTVTPVATAPSPTTATTTTTTPATTSTPGPGAAPAQAVPLWPSAKQAYTVVALTTPDRRAAEQRARQLIAKGHDAGILRSDKYDFFAPGAWVVYVGQFKDKPAAQAALPKLSADASSGYVTFVRSRH